MAAVFISYGRRDAAEFANRLAADLQRARHTVWIDRRQIEPGSEWDASIEDGIRDSDYLLAVLSPRAVERDSVCRKEVSFAIDHGRTVVPVRIMSAPDVKLTLQLSALDWLDFAGDYDDGLRALIQFLAGDAASLKPSWAADFAHRAALDFGPEIARLSKDFTGRTWFTAELERWIATTSKRGLVLLASPGFGKSAIAASLAERDDTVAVHFCTQQDTRSLDPEKFVQSLAAQLAVRLPGYAEIARDAQPMLARPTASDAFRDLIVQPARRLAAPPSPMLIVIDALDEAALHPGKTIVDVLSAQVPDFPGWLRLIMTSRPEPHVISPLRHLDLHELNGDRAENQADLRAYVESRVAHAFSTLAAGRRGQLTGRVVELADGLFLYARVTLDALEDGDLSIEDLGALGPGLVQFYDRAFTRLAMLREAAWPFTHRLMRALVVAREPVSFDTLAAVASGQREAVQSALLGLRSFLNRGRGGETTYALFHKSLHDWLVDRDAAGDFWCDERAGEDDLAVACLAEYRGGVSRMSTYALAHLASHLAAAGRAADIAPVLLDLDFVAENIRRVPPGRLVDDYARAQTVSAAFSAEQRDTLILLERTMRLSLNALAARPDQLSAQILGHLDPSLSPMIESLCARARAIAPERWLRPLSPGLLPADGPLSGTLRLHDRSVTALQITSDGSRLLSGGFDDRVVLWNVVTRTIERDLGRHRGGVRSLAISADQRLAVSGGNDHNVKLWNLVSGTRRGVIRHRGPVAAVALADARGLGVSVDVSGGIKLWTATDARVVARAAVKDRFWSVAISSDGLHALAGSRAGMIYAWRLHPFGLDGRWQAHDPGTDVNAILGADHRTCVSCGDDGRIRSWRVPTGELLQDVHLGPHVRSGALLAAHEVAAGTSHGQLALVDLDAAVPAAVHAAHPGEIRTIVALPADDLLVTGSSDSLIRQWSISRLHSAVVERVHAGGAAVAIAGTSERAVTVDRELAIWNLDTGAIERTCAGLPFYAHRLSVGNEGAAAVCQGQDGFFVISLNDGTIRAEIRDAGSLFGPPPRFVGGEGQVLIAHRSTLDVWDVATAGRAATVDCRAEILAFEPLAGDRVLVSTRHGGLFRWTPALGTLEAVPRPATGDITTIRRRAWGVALRSRGTVALCTVDGAALGTHRLGTDAYLRAFDTDGDVAAFGAEDPAPRVVYRDLATGHELSFDTDDPVWHIAISLDGRTLVASDEGGGVHILRREGSHRGSSHGAAGLGSRNLPVA